MRGEIIVADGEAAATYARRVSRAHVSPAATPYKNLLVPGHVVLKFVAEELLNFKLALKYYFLRKQAGC